MRRRDDRIEVLAHLVRARGDQRPGIPRRIKLLGTALGEYEDGRDLWREGPLIRGGLLRSAKRLRLASR